MALLQIKKKNLGNDQVDATKIKLLHDQTLRGTDALGNETDILGEIDQEIQEVRAEVVAEAVRATAAENVLDLKIDQEIEDRIAGDAFLQGEITAEVVRATAAEMALDAEIEAEKVFRASEDARVLTESKVYTDAEVLFEKNRAMAVEAGIQSELTALDLYVDATFVPLLTKGQPGGVAELNGAGLVPAEQLPSYVDDVLEYAELASFPTPGESGKIYVDISTGKCYRWAGLSGYIQITSGAVDTVFGRAGVVTAQPHDYSADMISYGMGFVSDELVSLDAEIEAEKVRAMAEEAVLDGKIEAEETRAMAEEALLDGKITTEKNRAMAAEAALQIEIDTEETRAMAAESVLRTDIASEVANRIAGDLTEKTRAMAAEAALDSLISEEVLARTAADSLETQRAILAEEELLQKIEEEKEERIAGDEEVETLIVFETQRAIAAEVALQGEIDAEKVFRASEDARVLSDSKIYTDAKVLTEKNRAEGIEAGLQTELDNFQVYVGDTFVTNASKGAFNGVASLNEFGQIPQEQLPSYVDDVLEFSNYPEGFPTPGEGGKIYVDTLTSKTYRWAGSSYFQITSGAVDTVFGRNGVVTANFGDYSADLIAYGMGSNVEVKLNSLQLEITNEESRAMAEELLLDGKIETEKARAMAEELVLDGKIEDEKTRAMAAEAALDVEIEAEKTRAMAAEVILDGKIDAEIVRAQLAESQLSARVTVLEADAFEFESKKFTVDEAMLTAGFVDLDHVIISKSLNAYYNRLAIFQTEDFLLSIVDGKTRVTFTGNLVDPSPEALAVGDQLRFNYHY